MKLVTKLIEVTNELGYCRNTFTTGLLVNTPEGLYNHGLSDYPDIENDYYIISDKATYTLVRSKDSKFISVTSININHLYSSVIKDIVLNTNYNINQKSEMILYILYYRTKHSAHSELSEHELTEGVILHLSNIIKTMIDREDTTYRSRPEISEAIDKFRRALIFEKAHIGYRQKINLRR